MRKNGFTLIELLAVIVILAIIALIATPIILGIINDAREKANERSVELYASAVRNAVAAYQLTHPNAPTKFSDLTVQYDGDVECTVEELYADGSFYLEGCKVNGSEKEYSYGTKQAVKGKMSICNPLSVQTAGAYTPGDKYECDVDPNKDGYDQIFYVLNADATSVNLIMDSNIRTGGEAVKEATPTTDQKGTVAWVSKTDYTREDIGGTEADYGEFGNNNKGPITAIEYLQAATAGWTNTNELTIGTYTDYNGEIYNMAKTYTVNARMPYYSEVSNYSESTKYLYDYLKDGGYQTNTVSEVQGYWTLSRSLSFNAFYVNYRGNVIENDLNIGIRYGVRPVINLTI